LQYFRILPYFHTRWFCEPAYEKLRNTQEGLVNSRLYSEKAYVLSRGFVRRALEIPLQGLESEISWLYYEQGRLQTVIRAARALIDNSGASEADDEQAVASDRAVPRLTAGGALMLSRTLVKLELLLEARISSVPAGTS
jgi:ubiquitin-conjugating enzyme E2 O